MLRAARAHYRRIRDGYYNFLKPGPFLRHAGQYARDRVGRRRYRLLSTDELLASRTSDTAFVFGSGRSLVELTQAEWDAIARFNTISLREFPRQQWIRADYHLTSEVDFLDEYAQRIRENPLYANAIFVVQGGFRALRGNELIGRGLLPAEARVFRFRRLGRSRYSPPSRTPQRLVHGFNSIVDATNLAVALGFRRIVLAGADYYNKEYFWLPAGETRTYERPGISAEASFAAHDAIIAMLGDWHDLLAIEGIDLEVLNPRSLLAQRLPVFDRSLLS
jgi:hypothetical protein